jgi:hypothetical protein
MVADNVPADEVTFTLTLGEYDRLLLMMGFAVGAAFNDKSYRLAYQFVDLSNRINRNNPHWTPYQIPDVFKSDTSF